MLGNGSRAPTPTSKGGVDWRKTKAGRGWERYPLAVGATALCSAVYRLTLHNWVHTSTKWRWLEDPEQESRGTDRAGYLSPSHLNCPPSLPPSLHLLHPFSQVSLWEGRAPAASSGSKGPVDGFCLHFLLILYSTMVIGSSGRVCIWCNDPPPHTHKPPLHLPSPHPVESSLKDLLLMS